ncbi:MAG: pilus assembly protein [Cyanobacteria bacterium]|nr:pilus assembly protein [Cyanobacteriota bacterium]
MRKRHQGQAIFELILGIIMFVLMSGAIISISTYLFVQHAVVSAVREGARSASFNSDLASSNPQTGIDAVRIAVQNFMTQTTGINLTTGMITVIPPDPAGTFGQRSVSVTIRYPMPNPLPIGAFMSALGANGTPFNQFNVVARAVMRYEE